MGGSWERLGWPAEASLERLGEGREAEASNKEAPGSSGIIPSRLLASAG